MHYFSTNRVSLHASFREAVLAGQPADRGLYFPSEIPRLRPEFIAGLENKANDEIAFEVIRPYIDGEIPDDELFAICSETVNFDFPLVRLTDTISVLELFHGPTLAFKDVGARFMSRCLRHFVRDRSEKTLVIVATSGDTGGAVAAGFFGIPDTEVIILFPKGAVSKVQELQLTTFGGNVTTLEVHGTFDDCQELAKRALADGELQSKVLLTSANSINVARWLPQQFYYFFAVKKWDGDAPVFAVPSGNFGNLASGMLANASGLPVDHFIAACNANDVVPRFMKDGNYDPKPSVATLSNAMDVGDPSNWVRVLEIFENNVPALKGRLLAVSVSDEETATTMRSVYDQTGYILDPHAAVAYRATADNLVNSNKRGIILETAHPIKFDSVVNILGLEPERPPEIDELYMKRRSSIEIQNDYDEVRDIIVSRI